jgi:hypothetical protein
MVALRRIETAPGKLAQVEVAARSLPRTPLRPERTESRRWTPPRPRPTKLDLAVLVWRMFNWYDVDF